MPHLHIDDEREEHARYAAYDEEHCIGAAGWALLRDTVLLPYIEVENVYRDLGIGTWLLRRAFDDARDQGRTVIPLCPFAKRFAQLNPDYRQITRTARPGETEALRPVLAATRTRRVLDTGH